MGESAKLDTDVVSFFYFYVGRERNVGNYNLGKMLRLRLFGAGNSGKSQQNHNWKHSKMSSVHLRELVLFYNL